jgi:TusA-related sulfurtransferase
MRPSFDQTLDIRDVKCPLPLVKSSQAVSELPVGNVLKVVANELGSKAVQMLAKSARNVEQIDQEAIQENGSDVYVHYLRRTR